MTHDNTTCPDDDALSALLARPSASEDHQALLVHLDGCESCRGLVADVVALTPESVATTEQLGRGDTIGRFVLHRVLGAGAMSVVYAAHDPQLTRDVAIKVLRRDSADRDVLLREARAVAKLAHPNVIAIYEVIADDDHLAIAMELVAGATLTSWLAARPRTWPQIRAVLLQAGRGIAAAHAVGIVHRDIKPDNILVASDGRVRVTDFGLANLPANVLAGTPAYMAPEQRAGTAERRSDVYSFCVVVHEALLGARPGDTPAARARVPANLRRALERGLARNPAERAASLDELLAALAPAKRHAVAIAAVAVATLAAVGGALVATRHAERCSGGTPAWGNLWNARAISDAFVHTGLPSATAAFARADAAMTSYRGAWIGAHREVCLATERGEQSAEALDRRMRCLENRRKDAAALAALMATADRVTADRAADLVQQLTPAAECTTTAIADLAPRFTSPSDRAVLDTIETRASEARAQQQAGRAGACRSTVDATLPDAQRLGYQPVIARLLYTRARCESDSPRIVDDLHAAAAAASAGRDDDTLARAWIRLIYMEGFSGHHFEEAARWEHYARAIIDRLGTPPNLQMAYLMDTSLSRIAQLRMDEARDLIEQRRAIIIATQGHQSPAIAEIEESLGNTYLDEWRYPEAYAHYQRAESLIDRKAPSINSRLWLLQNESVALRGLGRTQDALALFPTIFELSAERDPAGDDSWARGLYGDALRESGDPARALDEHRKARETCERFSPGEWRCAPTYDGEARDLLALGRPDDAAAPIGHALELYGSDGAPPDAPFVLALALEHRDPSRARALAEQARTKLRTLVDDRHADGRRLAEVETWLAAHGTAAEAR